MSNVIKLAKTFKFEGKDYNEIDLTGLEDLTTADISECEKLFERNGNFSALKEMNLEYCILVANKVTGLPVEFFNALPAREGAKVKQAVSAYFFQEV